MSLPQIPPAYINHTDVLSYLGTSGGAARWLEDSCPVIIPIVVLDTLILNAKTITMMTATVMIWVPCQRCQASW